MLKDMIPLQSDIEEFLGREFFPAYCGPMTLPETVDMVQLQFNVPDEARTLPVPRGHGCGVNGGTILECFTHFALLRLQERGFITRTGRNTYQWRGAKYFGKEISASNIRHCVYRLGLMATVGLNLADSLDALRRSKWDEATVLAAAHKFNLTKA